MADGGTGASTAAGARSNLNVDVAGTDNSTNVTLAGTPDYLTLTGQQITLNNIDLTTDVTGTLPIANGGTGATTATGILDVIKTVDGSGSGLDADTVDGLHASSFLQNINSQSIKDLSDVYSSMVPSDGQILTYDSTNSRWQAEDNTGGGGGTSTLSGVLANGNTTSGYNIVVSSGDSITTDTINETTAASGVTIDGVLLKDNAVTATGTSTFSTVDINGGTIDGATIGGSSAAAITGTTITGTSFVSSGDMTFGDNNKAIFGAGSDLQIYHDGSQSIIDDAGTGELKIRSNILRTMKYTGETTALFTADGAVSLYYDNAEKLATTSTGIDVTGTVTADGLTVDGLIKSDSASNGVRVVKGSGSYYGQLSVDYVSNEVLSYLDSIAGASYNGIVKIRTANNGGSVADRVRISSGSVSFYDSTGTSQNLFWDASASRLGLGTTSPETTLEIKSTGSSIAGLNTHVLLSDETAMAANVGGGVLFEGNYTTGGDDAVFAGIKSLKENGTSGNYAGALAFYSRANGSLPAERMRLGSTGTLTIGKTAEDIGTAGHAFAASGYAFHTRSGNTPLFINRLTNDGVLTEYRKDGTTVGSTGTSGGDIYVSSNTTGLTLDDTNLTVSPRNAVSSSDATLSLGRSAVRWKDLYLSGGVYLGGTGSANLLSDFEEGSWTPSVGGNATYNAQAGKYIKIGNQVTCWFNIYVNSLGTGSHVTVTGLPFTVSNITEFNANGNSMTYWSNINTACTYLAVKLDKNTTQFQFTNTTTATTTVGTTVSVYKDGADTYGTFTYRTG